VTARYADCWNWWSPAPPDLGELGAILGEVDRAWAVAGREPVSLRRSLDLYSLDPCCVEAESSHVIPGPADEIVARLLRLAELGFDEVRCNLVAGPSSKERRQAIEAMAGVVEAVHASGIRPIPNRLPGTAG